MKKDQSTHPKGTISKTITQTISFVSIPSVRSLKEAIEFIKIQRSLCKSHEKKVESLNNIISYKDNLIDTMRRRVELKEEIIEKLRAGDMLVETYTTLKLEAAKQDSIIKTQKVEMKKLKEELKKSKKFQYRDFIFN